MMKSFFKKLAFVMALAMVVTMAAPAGTAALAASFYIAKQTDKVEVTEFKLEVGKEQDFRYIGAADYKDHTWSWESSDKTVATVDKNGLVKGLKDGVATITVKGGTKYVASMVVTVGNGAPAVAGTSDYVVKQDTATTVKVIFNDATEYSIEDFELFYVIDGGWTISWPIKSVAPAKDANGSVIDGQYIVTPYVEFADGDKYILKVDGEEEGTEFVTSFGKLTHLEIHYTCNGVTDKNAVVNTIDEKDVYEVQCSVKFFAGEVDVTSLYEGEQDEVEYQMYSSDEDDIKFKKDGELTFKKAGIAAVVSATYEYKDKETNEKVEVKSLKAVPIVSVPLPEYNLTLVDWAIVNTQTQPTYEKIDWSVKTIRANDEALYGKYIVVAKFTDSFGKTFITNDDYLPSDKIKDGWYSPETRNTTFVKGKYELRYTSANNDKLLIGADDASLTTHTDADVAVIVGLYSDDKDLAKKSTGFVKNVAAFTVEVSEERYIASLDLSEDDIEVPNTIINAGDAEDEKTFLQKSVKLYILDQYGEAWKQNITDIEVIADEATGASVEGTVDYDKTKGYALVTVDGETIYGKATDDTVTLTIKVDKDNSIELDVTAVDVKTTDGTAVDYDETPELAVKDLDLATEKMSELPRVADIALTYMASDVAVGYAEKVTLYVNVLDEKGNEDVTKFPVGATEGTYFLAVYGPDNKLVPAATKDASGNPTTTGVYQKADGTFGLCAGINGVKDGVTDGVLDYLKTGDYRAELRIAEYDDDEKKLVTDDEEDAIFTVSDSSKKLEFVSLKAVETSNDTIFEIVDELVVVTVGGVNWNFDQNDILKVEGRYNAKANQIIIKKVWFKVALDASGKDEATVGYEASVEINRAIELKKGFDSTFDAEGFIKK